jgi:hypothetical protein
VWLSEIPKVLFRILLCVLGAASFGYLFFGDRLFNPTAQLVQVAVPATVAGLYLESMRLLRPRWNVGVVAAVFFVLTALQNNLSREWLLRDAVWSIALAVAAAIGLVVERKYPRLAIGKFVLWSALFSVVYILASPLANYFRPFSNSWNLAWRSAQMGAIVGAGVGLGHELAQLLEGRIGNRELGGAGDRIG